MNGLQHSDSKPWKKSRSSRSARSSRSTRSSRSSRSARMGGTFGPVLLELLVLLVLLELLEDLTCRLTAVKGDGTPSHHEIACPRFSSWPVASLCASTEHQFAGYHDS